MHVSPHALQDDVLMLKAMPGESLHYVVPIALGQPLALIERAVEVRRREPSINVYGLCSIVCAVAGCDVVGGARDHSRSVRCQEHDDWR